MSLILAFLQLFFLLIFNTVTLFACSSIKSQNSMLSFSAQSSPNTTTMAVDFSGTWVMETNDNFEEYMKILSEWREIMHNHFLILVSMVLADHFNINLCILSQVHYVLSFFFFQTSIWSHGKSPCTCLKTRLLSRMEISLR